MIGTGETKLYKTPLMQETGVCIRGVAMCIKSAPRRLFTHGYEIKKRKNSKEKSETFWLPTGLL